MLQHVTFEFVWDETDIRAEPGRNRNEKLASLLRDLVENSSDDELAAHVLTETTQGG